MSKNCNQASLNYFIYEYSKNLNYKLLLQLQKHCLNSKLLILTHFIILFISPNFWLSMLIIEMN